MPYRTPKFLSYSAISQFLSDRDEYFLRYIASERPPRAPQGEPASVGSAFDARVKAELYDIFYGVGYMPEKYSYEALFEKQVEEGNRDFAGPAGEHVFACYKLSGMFDRFVWACKDAIEPPQFEFRIEAEIGGVPILGLPDGYVKKKSGISLIADFKVNGYCAKPGRAVSPNKGYMKCCDGYRAPKQSRSHEKAHANHVPMDFGGDLICEQYMEDYEEKWASQLSGYAWCLGEDVGSEEFVCMIHQCVGKGLPGGARPLLRFSEYRSRVRKPFQEMLLRKYQRVWKAVTSGHIYDEMSRADSDAQCEKMDARAVALANDTHEHAGFFNNVTRPDWRG